MDLVLGHGALRGLACRAPETTAVRRLGAAGRRRPPSTGALELQVGWEVRARARARKLYASRARRTARAMGPARGARGTFDIVRVHLLVFSSLVDVGHELVG